MNRLLLILSLLLFTGCDMLNMYDEPRYEPLEASEFFADGMSARPLVEGTIPRGELREDVAFYTGIVDGKPISEIPQAAFRAVYDRDHQKFAKPFEDTPPEDLRRALLARGQQRFNIHCSVCHDYAGTGDGMVVRRGFRHPPSYHIDRLRQAPAGHFFDVMSNGFGAMPSYANRIEVADRWAIVAYVRALQLSQNAPLADVPSGELKSLEAAPAQEKAQ